MTPVILNSLDEIKKTILFFQRKYRSQVSCYDDPKERIYGFLIFHDNPKSRGIYDANVILDGCYGIRLSTLKKLKITGKDVEYFKAWTQEPYVDRIYFLREKIICLQKLLEIPELYQEVYYGHKTMFLELLKKL